MVQPLAENWETVDCARTLLVASNEIASSADQKKVLPIDISLLRRSWLLRNASNGPGHLDRPTRPTIATDCQVQRAFRWSFPRSVSRPRSERRSRRQTAGNALPRPPQPITAPQALHRWLGA